MDYVEAREIIKRVGMLNRKSEELRNWANERSQDALCHLYGLVFKTDYNGSAVDHFAELKYPDILTKVDLAAKEAAWNLRQSIEEEIKELKARLDK